MSGRLFDPSADQPFQSRAIIPQMNANGAGAVPSAMAHFGAAASGAADDMLRAQRQAEAAGAEAHGRARMTTGLAELRHSLRAGDPSTIPQRWQEGANTLRERVASELPERQRGVFGRLAEQMIASGTGNVLALQTQRTGEVGRANLIRGTDDLVRAAALGGPEDRAEALTQVTAMVDAAVAGGLVSPDVAARVLVGARSRFDRLAAQRMVSSVRGRGPGALAELPLPPMPPEDMEALRAQATEEMIAAGAEADAEERASLTAHEATVTETLSRAMGGEGSVDELMPLRHSVEPSRYRAAMTVAGGQAATRDVTAEVDDLTARVGIESEGTYRQRLDNALAVQAITPQTHARLRDLDMSLRGQDPATGNRRQARERILDAFPDEDLAELEGDTDLGAPFTSIRTNTFNAWEEWSAANPQAGPTERREALNAAVMVGLQETVRTALRILPRPATVQMEPGQPPKLDDIEKAESDLLAALDELEAAGDAGDAAVSSSIADELALLERWRIVSVFQMEADAGETNILGRSR